LAVKHFEVGLTVDSPAPKVVIARDVTYISRPSSDESWAKSTEELAKLVKGVHVGFGKGMYMLNGPKFSSAGLQPWLSAKRRASGIVDGLYIQNVGDILYHL
jgi:hypothetical protein